MKKFLALALALVMALSLAACGKKADDNNKGNGDEAKGSVYYLNFKPEADKADIKKEVEALYGVKVLAVNTMCYAGKRMSRYTKQGLVKGQRNAFKKAIVTLKNGDAIDFYSNIK